MSSNDRKKKDTNVQDTRLSSAQSNGATYVESDTVRQAKNALGSLQKPGEYQASWQQSLNDVIGKIQNREKFSYDLNGDALYQQYKDQFVTQGQQAMMDTMGQAAALTGGYGNSYAQTVGQQTYQGYLQGLNDKVPELYQLALDQYNREGEDLYNQYSLYADRDDTEYGRYRDSVSDYNTERDYLTSQYQTERDFDYGKHIDERDYTYQVARDAVADEQWNKTYDRGVYEFDTQFDYQKDRDSVADKQWQKEFNEDVRQFDTNVALTREEMDIQQNQWQAEFNESVKRADQNYELNVKQIEEDIRHNKISESQGQQQLDLAKAEFEQQKAEAAQDYSYKMASLKAQYDYSEEDEGDVDEGAGGGEVDYSDWSKGDWHSYFSAIRQSEGQSAAEKELNELTRQGVIPKDMVVNAALGARGGKLGH